MIFFFFFFLLLLLLFPFWNFLITNKTIPIKSLNMLTILRGNRRGTFTINSFLQNRPLSIFQHQTEARVESFSPSVHPPHFIEYFCNSRGWLNGLRRTAVWMILRKTCDLDVAILFDNDRRSTCIVTAFFQRAIARTCWNETDAI